MSCLLVSGKIANILGAEIMKSGLIEVLADCRNSADNQEIRQQRALGRKSKSRCASRAREKKLSG